jgi:hypothetical protein
MPPLLSHEFRNGAQYCNASFDAGGNEPALTPQGAAGNVTADLEPTLGNTGAAAFV